jgi:hypothetical protein
MTFSHMDTFTVRAVVFIAAIAFSWSGYAASISATVLEQNGNTTPGDGNVHSLTPASPAALTATNTTGYNFGAQTLSSIMSIQVTLTLQDGDSASGNFDFNHLFLALDGINTGLALNGFPGSGLQDTLTISGNVTPTIGASLLTAFSDHQFVGTIITNNASDTAAPNDIFAGNNSLNATTTLVLNDTAIVPEPTSIALLCAGSGILFGLRRLRRR